MVVLNHARARMQCATMQSTELTADSSNRLADLPPLPEPDRRSQRWQAAGGTALVVGIVVVLVGLTHGVGLTVGELPRDAWWACLVLIYTEAGVALLCLLMILLGDPGIIRRNEQTCFPLPDAVREKLARGESLEGMGNIEDGEDSFCVRCLVWRRQPDHRSDWFAQPWQRGPKRAHHCRTCGRCVASFDHHCGVFGRCIAGNVCFSGNMPYFCTIFACSWAGGMTCAGAVLVGVANRFGGWTVGVIVGASWGGCVCLNLLAIAAKRIFDRVAVWWVLRRRRLAPVAAATEPERVPLQRLYEGGGAGPGGPVRVTAIPVRMVPVEGGTAGAPHAMPVPHSTSGVRSTTPHDSRTQHGDQGKLLDLD
jgi:hypothetical protein